MSAFDRYGHTSLYKKKGDETPAVEFHIRENDGWTYSREGPNAHVVINFKTGLKVPELEQILAQHESIDKDARRIMKRMIKKNEIKSGPYRI